MTEQTETRQIRVYKSTRELLRVLKRDGETWPEVVDRVLSGQVSEEEVEVAKKMAQLSARGAEDASGGI